MPPVLPYSQGGCVLSSQGVEGVAIQPPLDRSEGSKRVRGIPSGVLPRGGGTRVGEVLKVT
eukprot:5758526-Pyramimonas_sp.AAC.1